MAEYAVVPGTKTQTPHRRKTQNTWEMLPKRLQNASQSVIFAWFIGGAHLNEKTRLDCAGASGSRFRRSRKPRNIKEKRRMSQTLPASHATFGFGKPTLVYILDLGAQAAQEHP